MAELIFATLTLRNFTEDPSNDPFTLNFAPSYPAPPYFPLIKTKELPESWAPKDGPSTESCLDVTLLDRISEGRIGVVYLAHVEKATRAGVDISSSLPENVCLKFAKRHHCRSLAREAWFYEQLWKLQGISVAKCYGFYSSTVKEQSISAKQFQPWTQLLYPSRRDLELAKQFRSMDWLKEDSYPERFGPSIYAETSQWHTWNPDRQNPNIGVLVLEKLGDQCAKYWSWKKRGSKINDNSKNDILAVLEDVAEIGLNHTDITARNLLQYDSAEGDAQTLCPRHDVVHVWRLIDFDRSCMVDLTNARNDASVVLKDDRKSVGNRYCFWGDVEMC